METDAADLIFDGGNVMGVRAKTPEGDLEIQATLVVACDGRHSTVRQSAKLKVEDVGAPIDVLWFRLSRKPGDTDETGGHIEAGRMLVTLNRGDYWQCAYVIPKGGIETVKREGLAAFRDRVSEIEPFLKDRVGELKSFDDIKLLTVAIDRLRQWHRPGLLCIGDAAHAMSPVGGVGINLAIQDAIATANLLSASLLSDPKPPDDLARVQARREFPAKATQAMQVFIQDRVIRPALAGGGKTKPPLLLRLFAVFPVLRRVPGRIIGLGVRPERIDSPVASGASRTQ
jgi:2-polyprenyl-6-methoxyphenol hydroxylase-like FAD-dependent oxidoreductase